MIITAKFASVCPCCSARIAVGSKVEWSKGEKARHVTCGGAAASVSGARSQAPARRRGTWTGCSCGSVEEYARPGDCYSCRHDRD